MTTWKARTKMPILRNHSIERPHRQRLSAISSSFLFHVFVSIIIISLVFLHPPTLFQGDTDTARNYLNTIVSSLSTILALCISIILVAIQLTASNYTHRVLDFYVRMPYNGSLFLIYLVTIMHSFFLMAQIHEPLRDPLSPQLQKEMSADLVLVLICFLSMLLYMYAVVQLLKPERIVALILRDYRRAVQRQRWRSALDNIEQICDIAKRAASVSDSVTGTYCLQRMLEAAQQLPLATEEEAIINVHQSYLDQWSEIIGVAVKERETGLLLASLEAMYQHGCDSVNAESWTIAERVVRTYKQLALGHLLPESQAFYVEPVVHYLYELSRQAAGSGKRGRLFALRTWRVIQSISHVVFSEREIDAPHYLTHKAIQEIFFSLGNHRDLADFLTVYFNLVKSFFLTATLSDVRLWADWWEENMLEHGTGELGVELAKKLAEHIQRGDVLCTLSAIWPCSPTILKEEKMATAQWMDFRLLFDGWPQPTLDESSDVMSQHGTNHSLYT
ncbi:DUF2254 domain-containing protein [Alicyclobacillus sp. TC]|uniref:DUF2254 family protein n=1 Tax=Alicyclobacillus sp. TC TaxID=2606450 RepID=UPI00193141D9|nr:DUF2254 family protein [Alicyclobacillus sp. TC]QRF23788.1 DUF2254 domain-containing protein [Alicyclobacillus sp. TC]